MRRLLMLTICLSGLLAGCTADTGSTTSSGDGSTTGTPWVDLSWSGIGDSNVASEQGDCTTYPGNMIDVPELFPDGTAEGNVCLTVSVDDVESLVLILEESFSLEETRVFFALH